MNWGKLIQICVHVQGKDFLMDVYDDLTLAQLKTRVADQCKVPVELQLYRFNQRTLWHDDKALCGYYRIKNASKLTLKIYKKEKIEKLKQQHIFLKLVSKTYERVEKEHKKSNHDPSILREIQQYYNAKALYQLALKETIEWPEMDKWMYQTINGFVAHYEKEGKHVFKTITINIGAADKIRQSIKKKRVSLIQFNNKNTSNNNNSNNNNNDQNLYKLRAEHRLNSISSTLDNNKLNTQTTLVSMSSTERSIDKSKSRSSRAGTNSLSRGELSKTNSKSKSPYYTRNIHNTFHRFHKYEYRNALCCCCADNGYKINTKLYYLFMILLLLICSLCSLFVLFQVNQMEVAYSRYLIRSQCNVYNSSYAIWVAYDAPGGDPGGSRSCYRKSREERRVDQVYGDIEYPKAYFYGNVNVSDNDTTLTTMYPDLRYLEHICFVTENCDEIFLSENKGMIDNPYEENARNWKVLLIFLWICVTIIAFCVCCVFVGDYGQKHDHYEMEWMGTPNDWKCEYFIGYSQKKYCLEMDRKMKNRITEMVWRYHNTDNVSQSKNSAFI